MPDLQEQQLSSQDDALILASDGLWDVLTNQDAAQLIQDIKVRQSYITIDKRQRNILCDFDMLSPSDTNFNQ